MTDSDYLFHCIIFGFFNSQNIYFYNFVVFTNIKTSCFIIFIKQCSVFKIKNHIINSNDIFIRF